MKFFLASLKGTILKSGAENFLNAIVPLLKILSMTVLGLILAHRKWQIVPKETFKQLSKLVFALFLPCLIFTHLGPCISLNSIILWWFIPLNVVLSTAIGCVLGFLVAIICRPPPEYFRFTIIMTAFGNTGNLSLAIVSSVCHSTTNPFGEECYASGVAYVSFSQWVAVIMVYTLVYHMMEPPLEYYEIVEEGETDIEEVQAEDLSRPLLVDSEWPGVEDKETEHCKTAIIARLFYGLSGISQSTVPDLDPMEEAPRSSTSIRCLAEPRMIRKIRIVAEKTPIHHILQPPTIASLLAILLGLIPTLKSFVFTDDSVVSFITDSLNFMAEAMVPSTLLVLGGMLAEGPTESNLGIRTTIGIIVARLLILPLFGIGVIILADKFNFLVSGDEMYRFVLLLQYTTPSAILLGAIASLRGYAVNEASALLFWQHVFALFSLSLYITLYFKFSTC
ncbi:putative transporter C5D6.04 [Morella rubra]|uniref:Putative transporter C5D6.04 n=1 Tax=Morella rubra TaxID=262757 RepID=A0A6A1VEH3_9ROSI|nr:putative transporter C5D6.04 [Morella rubra]